MGGGGEQELEGRLDNGLCPERAPESPAKSSTSPRAPAPVLPPPGCAGTWAAGPLISKPQAPGLRVRRLGGVGRRLPPSWKAHHLPPSGVPSAPRRGHQTSGNNGARGAGRAPGHAWSPAARPDTGQRGRVGLQPSLTRASLMTPLYVAATLPTLARLRGVSPTLAELSLAPPGLARRIPGCPAAPLQVAGRPPQAPPGGSELGEAVATSPERRTPRQPIPEIPG